MKATRKVQKTYIVALFLVSLVLIASIASSVHAKYIKEFPFTGNVSVEADLVGTFKLYESEASRTELGDYSLVSDTEVSSNSYMLMPGVNIPKDPTISITGKSSVPAYLYIEVVDDITDSAIHYDLTSDWTQVEGILGPQGGKVYVYKEVLDGSVEDYTIGIIAENTIEVKEGLKHPGESFSLNFHAYMAQKNGDATADDVFTSTFTHTTH